MKVLLTMALAIFTLSSFGQSDQRLEAMFSKEQIKNLASDSPGTLEFWSFVAESGATLQDAPAGKEADVEGFEVLNFDENFNLLAHNELIGAYPKFFKDQNTGKLVTIKSMPQIVAEYNEKKEK